MALRSADLSKQTPFEKDQTYYLIKESLIRQKASCGISVLNVHIPGTGCTKDDALPTRLYLHELTRDFADRFMFPPATINFEGTGSMGENYIPPAMNNPNTLAQKSKGFSWSQLFKASTASELDGSVASHAMALPFGLVFGAGKNTNNQRIVGALKALQEEGCLPDVMLLTGHSRGAINCISMSNRIFQEFSHKIKLHFLLTDPVAGPFYKKYWDVHVVPPNTVSFTVFYAADEARSPFVANDFTRLIFVNPATTITGYAVKGNHQTFFEDLDNKFGKHMREIVYLINGVYIYHGTTHLPIKDDQSTLQGQGARKNSEFHKVTGFNTACNKYLVTALNSFRFRCGDRVTDANAVRFEEIPAIFDTPEKREKFLIEVFDSRDPLAWKHTQQKMIEDVKQTFLKELIQFKEKTFPEKKSNLGRQSFISDWGHDDDEDENTISKQKLKSFLDNFILKAKTNDFSLSKTDRDIINDNESLSAIFEKYKDIVSLAPEEVSNNNNIPHLQ